MANNLILYKDAIDKLLQHCKSTHIPAWENFEYNDVCQAFIKIFDDIIDDIELFKNSNIKSENFVNITNEDFSISSNFISTLYNLITTDRDKIIIARQLNILTITENELQIWLKVQFNTILSRRCNYDSWDLKL